MRNTMYNSDPERPFEAQQDLLDAEFIELFAQYPDLNTQINNRVEQTCQNFLDTVELEEGVGTHPKIPSRLHFEIKKLLFLFTECSDPTNTVSDADMRVFMMGPYVNMDPSLSSVPSSINRYTRDAGKVHSPIYAKPWESFGNVWASNKDSGPFTMHRGCRPLRIWLEMIANMGVRVCPIGIGLFVWVKDIGRVEDGFDLFEQTQDLFAKLRFQPRPAHQTIVVLTAE